MFCGDFHTNVCQLFNTKFSLLIYLSTCMGSPPSGHVIELNVHFARNLEFAGVELLLSEILTQKWLNVSLNYSVILALMWPNLARTGLQKYAACRQRLLSWYRSAKMIA